MTFKLKKPLSVCWVTQPFGVDWSLGKLPLGNGKFGNYASLGLKAHNGIDFKAPIGTEVYAAHDGFVLLAEIKGGYGNSVVLRNSERTYDTIYGHLKDCLVRTGDEVKAGDVIGLADNTGISTGSHLHFGLRPVNYDADNGYFGWIDPAPFMEEGWLDLPVDKRYGRARNWLAEWTLRFKNPWVHRRLIKIYHRSPLSLTSREVNAIIYGGWGFDETLNDALKPISWFLTKAEWQSGKMPPINL